MPVFTIKPKDGAEFVLATPFTIAGDPYELGWFGKRLVAYDANAPGGRAWLTIEEDDAWVKQREADIRAEDDRTLARADAIRQKRAAEDRG